MTDNPARRPRWVVLVALTLGLGACAHGPSHVAAPPAPAASHQSEIDTIQVLLDQGRTDDATKKIRLLLKRNPSDPEARVLGDSIDRDPVELLGPKSFPYTVRAGDTMIGLAERFLGNRLKSYQLARYNGVAVPATLPVGRVLRIPGEAPNETPSPREAPTPMRPAPPTPPRVKPAVLPHAAQPAPDPALAARLRAAGLAALNQGKVDRAVGLLNRAAMLDPGNAVIERDRDRALRISRTVQARR